ncbi:phosphoribosyl 1,2-cyclic phosphate phosphodiesterase [Catalinimonas alkaloidigena]|uniref:Phosphoribosyl 1,2-cyclic phosphate phosphodiesterase n=1 Tax=Catalinimonas alkaloidigena TaxID=1075417 RepID=A0A1G9GS92_9BACT|nr:phosphoribosyl 1,2-cyclic phosphate phosphodiesterase [Catalinimonas alkaloidigena]
MIGCDCEVCRSLDFRDKRLRTSVHLAVGGKSLVIDTGPDFRQQMLRERIKSLDAVLFTHEHRDHTAGLDDVRPFNFMQGRDMPLYGRRSVLNQLTQDFAYAFSENPYPGVPRLRLHEIDHAPFEVEGIAVTPIEVFHHKLPVFGFRLGDFTYITDASEIAEAEKEKIRGSRVLVINALQEEPHISHFTLQEAIALMEELAPEQGYFTHISHRLGLYREVAPRLPAFVELAYDGLVVEL